MKRNNDGSEQMINPVFRDVNDKLVAYIDWCGKN